MRNLFLLSVICSSMLLSGCRLFIKDTKAAIQPTITFPAISLTPKPTETAEPSTVAADSDCTPESTEQLFIMVQAGAKVLSDLYTKKSTGDIQQAAQYFSNEVANVKVQECAAPLKEALVEWFLQAGVCASSNESEESCGEYISARDKVNEEFDKLSAKMQVKPTP